MSWAIILPVILGIAILGLVGFSQDAEAATMTFTTDTTITSESMINNGETWTINPGVTLTIDARLVNHGEIVNFGTVLNNDDFENHPHGKIENHGEIVQTGDIRSAGIINNFDGSTFIVSDNVDIEKGGRINNFDDSTIIINDQIKNFGIINNFVGATIIINPDNDGLWNTTGTVNNFGTIINNNLFQNYSITSNLNNFCGSIFQNNGVVDNFGGITGGNIIDNGIVNNEDGSVFQAECEANLFVSAENSLFDNYMSGPQVIEVVIVDPNLDDINIPRGEPDVTVNGKDLRMVQAVDGNWYGYFANLQSANAADATQAADSGKGLDFGVGCTASSASDISGVMLSGTKGIYFPNSLTGVVHTPGSLVDCSIASDTNHLLMHVVRESKSINTDPNIGPGNGQIGLADNMWPFIQLYDLNPQGSVYINYNKGGGTQSTVLTFDTVDYLANLEANSSAFPTGAQVLLTLTDLQLNIDPTDEDSWTWGTNPASNTAFYQLFDENGNADADGTLAAVNLIPVMNTDEFMFEDNGIFLIDLDAQGSGTEVLRIIDNDDSQTDGTINIDASTVSTDGGSVAAGNQPVTFTELGSNSGIFGNYDESDVSNLAINHDASRGTSATLDYNETPKTVLVGFSTTIKIADNITGGDCTLFGSWDHLTKTCTLATNLVDKNIEIIDDGITLDGNEFFEYELRGNGVGNGIVLVDRTNVTIKNLKISGFGNGIAVKFGGQNIIENNIVDSNLVPYEVLPIIVSSNSNGIILERSVGNTINNNDLNNNRDGITLRTSTDNILSNNFLHDNAFSGIKLEFTSNFNQLTDNTSATNENFGISLFQSSHNVIENNLVDSNDSAGIFLSSSAFNKISDNEVIDNVHHGVYLGSSRENVVKSNNIQSNGDGLRLSHSTTNIIEDNEIDASTGKGMSIVGSSNNNFRNNHVQNSASAGASLLDSNENVFVENTFRSNLFGVSLFRSNDNSVYNNNFLDVTPSWLTESGTGNIFNLALPIGGNHWNTFDEPAEGCDDINNDGLCDAPFVIHELGILKQDNLPWTEQNMWQNPPEEFFSLSKNPDFSTQDREFDASDTIHILVSSGAVDTNNMKKAEYKIEDSDKNKVQGNISLNPDGIFTTTVSLASFESNSAKVEIKLEDKDRKKFNIREEIFISGEPVDGISSTDEFFILSQNSDFTTFDTEYTTSDTLHMLTFSNFVDTSNMKKAEYKIEDSDKNKVQGNLSLNLDGTFSASISLDDLNSDTFKVELKLEDNDKKKFNIKKYVTIG